MKQVLFSFLFGILLLPQLSQAQVIYNSSGRQGQPQYRKNQNVKGFDASKIVFGSGLDFGLVSRYFRVGVSPFVGYRFNNILAAGVNARFQYSSYRDYFMFPADHGGYHYKPWRFRYYGPGAWVRTTFWDAYFVQVDFEYNFMDEIAYEYQHPYSYKKIIESYTAPSLLLGVGYKGNISDKISLFAILSYDVLQNIESNMQIQPGTGQRYSLSPYADQLTYRVGIAFGL